MNLTVTEHHLSITADPLRLKIITEALRQFQDKNPELMDDTTLNDFIFNMETTYQSFYCLDQDDWGAMDSHKEECPFLS